MATEALETAQEKVREGADSAISDTRETAKQAGSQAKSTLREQADQRSTQAGDRIKSFAGDFHTTAEELRKQGKDQPAELIEQVAGRAESLGDYLTQADGEQLMSDAERFGRQRPWAVAAAGFAIGLAASRMLKASSADRYSRSVGQGQPGRSFGQNGGASAPSSLPNGQTNGQTYGQQTTEQTLNERALVASSPVAEV
jgi:ElaB/YqjD/DUF883 family membrane-anchored ribosome-binding protein